jgi:hypothetical protein
LAVIRGIGIAVPVREAVGNARDCADALELVLKRFPDAVIVRNHGGHLSIVSDKGGGRVLYHGWINILTGDVHMLDAPWREAA